MTQATTEAAAPFKLSPANRRVFAGLLLGMLVASISQTIVGPAMPRIVAELGGMNHYSWVATAAMLVSAVSVPIVGKFADLYGRRSFYLGGLVVFMVGSLLAGLTTSFGMLILARAIQGLGMGTIMPLSQTVIGDIIPARQRGKYQGYMGAVFGVTSVAGPLAGGWITDHWGWRWLFFAAIPLGLVALVVLAISLHIPHERREVSIDWWGMATLTPALVAILLATSMGGSEWAWNSWQTYLLYGAGLTLLGAFVFIELRADEPVLPLRLFKSSVFTFANLAAFFVAMVMFGAIYYIPVFAQGVLGVNATNSGLLLMPLMLGMIVLGLVSGLLVTKTGKYKAIMVTGVIIMAAGIYLLTRLGYGSSRTALTVAMVVIGVGLGMSMQQYTLVVQNNASRRDLGVATAATQFFRNVGSTVGIAICGSLMTSGLQDKIMSYLPREALEQMGDVTMDASAVLDPSKLSALPEVIQTAVRHGLGDQLHNVFLALLPLTAAVLIATALIKAVPLRDSTASAETAGVEMLDAMSQSNPESHQVIPYFAGWDTVGARTRERILGYRLDMYGKQAMRDDRPLLTRAVSELGDGDLHRGVGLLREAATMLTSEDPAAVAQAEQVAARLAAKVRKHTFLSDSLRRDIAVGSTTLERGTVLGAVEPTVQLATEAVDVEKLFDAADDLGAAFMIDVVSSQDNATARHAE